MEVQSTQPNRRKRSGVLGTTRTPLKDPDGGLDREFRQDEQFDCRKWTLELGYGFGSVSVSDQDLVSKSYIVASSGSCWESWAVSMGRRLTTTTTSERSTKEINFIFFARSISPSLYSSYFHCFFFPFFAFFAFLSLLLWQCFVLPSSLVQQKLQRKNFC